MPRNANSCRHEPAPRVAARAADKCTQSAQLICFRGALAFRRSAAALARALTPWLSSRPCFLGRGLRRALPALSYPSPGTAPPAAVLVPQGVMPKAARERSASFRARAPPLLRPSKVPSRKAPSLGRVRVR